MKVFQLPAFLLLICLALPLSGQYEGVSPYFNDPALSIGYVDSCAQFWMNTYDGARGGFYTNIDREGNVISAWGTNKNLLTQSRNAYGFARAFMLTGNETYLSFARAGLDFMYDYAWDDVNGGWYSQLDENGNALGATNGRSAFDAHYALLGPAAAFEAFRDSLDLNMLNQGYEHLENVYWDDRETLSGYYDWATYTGSASHNKSFNATVDAITTHLLSNYQLTGDPVYLERMHQICEQIIDHLVGSMPTQAIGFAEEYDSDWNIDSGETMTIMGHVLKSAWCLARVYLIDPREEYLLAAEALMSDVLEFGYDHDFGGPYKDYNRTTGEMLMWSNPDTAKAWWQMEQAITAGYTLWTITGNDDYLRVADESLHFFMRYFVDHTYGDIYENRTRYGAETWGTHKGGGGKAAYHSIETGYYNYIYASLFVHQQPISLYYWFEPEAELRIIPLNPVINMFDPPIIVGLEVNGQSTNGFEDNLLYIPAGSGGKFRVTFMPGSQTAIEPMSAPQTFSISPAYPNPFNGQTHFNLKLEVEQTVGIAVYDLNGRLVKELYPGLSTPGLYELSWDGLDQSGASLATGLYLISFKSGAELRTQKVLLLK